MSRYRKVDTRIMLDEKYRDLTDDSKLIFLTLLVHPDMTALGAMKASIATLAEDMEWSAERLREALSVPLAKGMVRYHERARLIALPNFLKYNAPENPNVVKAWAGSVDLLPECDLKDEVIQWAYRSLDDRTKPFAEAFRKSLGKPLLNGSPNGMANQEQEQEPEQEQKPEPTDGSEIEGLVPTREPDEYPFDPPEDEEQARRFLIAKGLQGEHLKASVSKLMAFRLYPSDIVLASQQRA